MHLLLWTRLASNGLPWPCNFRLGDRGRGIVAGAVLLLAAAHGQNPGTGIIEGRVLLPATGEFIEGARLSIEGANLEAFSDAAGAYRLTNVPAGLVTLKLFHTLGTAPAATVNVAAGQTVQRDFQLVGLAGSPVATGQAVRMDEFVVATSREMEGAALAINEQRFAPNLKNVHSTDEFGGVADGNVAEFLKNFAGVTISYSGGNAREVSIDGVPATNVPVTIGGFNLASAGQAVTSRTVALDMVSINNMSRIEVNYSPTPESQGSALAGSVNMVPRSSLERARPVFSGSVFLMLRDDARDFHRTPGPRRDPTRKVHPGFEVSAVVPVNKRFGFTLSASSSTNYSSLDLMQNFWRGTTLATNGVAFPHTTFDRPYLSSYAVRDGAKYTTRNSFGVTADFRLAPNDRLAFAFSMSTFDAQWMFRTLTFNTVRVVAGDFSPTHTRGVAGAGNLTLVNAGNNRTHRTLMPTLTWRHDGPVWKAEAGAAYSQAINHNRGTDSGAFRNSTATRGGVTVSFAEVGSLRPGVVTTTDATGAPIDPYQISSYAMTSVDDTQNDSDDYQKSVYANVRRDFFGRVPISLKAGFEVRQGIRDLRADRTLPHTFVGRDGRTSNTPAGGDDGATPFLDASYSQRTAPWGFPRIEWVSNERLWEYFQANPSHFQLDANAQYRDLIAPNKRAEEIVSAAYLRGDVALLDRRLKLTGGLRAEQTNISAWGPLTDPTRNFQRTAQGAPILGANGRPLLITSDPLGISRLTFLSRGSETEKEYLRLFPSLNASYNLRENLVVRAAHFYSVGRPDYNQYAGGLTLPDLGAPPSPNNRITVNNAGIKAWRARSTNVRLEYYFEKVGQISATAFRRDIQDFFGGTTFVPTPEFLALYDLSPSVYDGYEVATQANVAGTVRLTGISLNYRQALTFLPVWARGVQVFANGSAQRATGPRLGSFTGAFYSPRSGSAGFSVTRPAWNVRLNYNYRGRQRRAEVAAGSSIEPGTYNWGARQTYTDVLGEYYFRKRFAVFANLRNLYDTPDDFEAAGPSTPAHAQFRQRERFGSLWTFGVKGTF
ncbi:MAG: carboxypeptidase regulatory-like domain-containing protein [Verrucomicrobia bacterium]|nr:carboxypeptidase regulatory-like domain-containing protein [Verrucomicrobiota bacterium]